MHQEEAEEGVQFVDGDGDVVDLILANPPPLHRRTSM